MNNVLSLAEVAKIRRNLNPEKAFAPGTTHGELKLKNYNQVVCLFKRRVTKWYPAKIKEEILYLPDKRSCLVFGFGLPISKRWQG